MNWFGNTQDDFVTIFLDTTGIVSVDSPTNNPEGKWMTVHKDWILHKANELDMRVTSVEFFDFMYRHVLDILD